MDRPTRFHLSLVTADLDGQREFYVELLGCRQARVGADFEDFDFFGHQLTFHHRSASLELPYALFHFGAIISWSEFDRVAARLLAAPTRFVIEPQTQGAHGAEERRKMVFLDPSGYAVELKCYVDEAHALSQGAAYPRIPAAK
ncbi:MAG: Glyoxalase/bleomycin resistance protein/dioxygenase [Myxococcaceae bacterium]|nr:Glyoxalase/bleomycin resistance protein/dioxygenase [Myxococcaceae bacterium]